MTEVTKTVEVVPSKFDSNCCAVMGEKICPFFRTEEDTRDESVDIYICSLYKKLLKDEGKFDETDDSYIEKIVRCKACKEATKGGK